MNRRGFLSSMLKAGVGAMILPPALTYARRWVPTSSGILISQTFLVDQAPVYDALIRLEPISSWSEIVKAGEFPAYEEGRLWTIPPQPTLLNPNAA